MTTGASRWITLVVVSVVATLGCGADNAALELGPVTLDQCAAGPRFVAQADLPPDAALSTVGRGGQGIKLTFSDTATGQQQEAVEPSWTDYGDLGNIVFDGDGNVYVAPYPTIDVARNPVGLRNTVLRLDSTTALLEPWARLPIEHDPRSQPFGILGSFLDCETSSLIVTSVSMSKSETEAGQIWRIDLETAEPTLVAEGVDATAVAVATMEDQRVLLWGHARSNRVRVAAYDGKAVGRAVDLMTYQPRGADLQARVQKFRQTNDGQLELALHPFNFSLRAVPDGRLERLRLEWNDEVQRWTQA